MSNDDDWISTEKEVPDDGTIVQAMDSGGHVQDLLYDRRLWWFPDQSMYVYFIPTFWKAKT